MLLAELAQQGCTARAQRRLQAARPVVDARMHDAAVVAALVHGHAVFLLEDRDRNARMADEQLARHRQPEHAATNDGD